jgi:hypothetical protein
MMRAYMQQLQGAMRTLSDIVGHCRKASRSSRPANANISIVNIIFVYFVILLSIFNWSIIHGATCSF